MEDKMNYKHLDKENFNDFYNILVESFPEDERRGQAGQYEVFQDDNYKVLGFENEEKLIGFIAYWEFDAFIYIEHFAFAKECRNKGYGSKILNDFIKSSPKKVILEVELPKDSISINRIKFYERNKFLLNDYYYMQPAYEKDRSPIELKLMSYPAKLSLEEFENFKENVYNKVYKNC